MSDDEISGSVLPATAAISWLLFDGAQAATAGTLLGELCARLATEGLPIAGAVLTVANLDPMVAKRRLAWRREDGRVVEEIQFHGMPVTEAAPAAADSFQALLRATNHQIEWTASSVFDQEQRSYLEKVCLAMTAPLQVVVGRENTKNLLQAYLGRRSSEKVLSGTIRRGTGEMIEAVIWISDLRDFTFLSQSLTPEQIIKALNECCARLVGAIHPYGGEVLKFIGDGLLAIFPLAPRGAAAAFESALSAARAARQGMARLDEERQRQGLSPLPFGLALHVGTIMFGNIGAPDRLDFTAIGPAVNLASRIEGLCRPLGCPVLISEALASLYSAPLTPVGRHTLRGISEPVMLFTLPELAQQPAQT